MYFANANVIIHFFLCFSGLCSLFCKYGNCNAIVLKLEEVIKIHPASILFFQRYLAQKCKIDYEYFKLPVFKLIMLHLCILLWQEWDQKYWQISMELKKKKKACAVVQFIF